tara:strand:- start:436 stop:1203 length:768 start_codon:yes stop_codon:yes gene_type:complete
MLNKLKRWLIYFLVIGACFSLGILAVYSTTQSLKLSTKQEIQSLDNITDNISSEKKRAIWLSRNSSVNIMSLSTETESIASSSGTYIKYRNSHYILTVSHGVRGSCEQIRIVVQANLYECQEISALNKQHDYAIIKVEEIEELSPIRIPRSLPKNSAWDEQISIQTGTIYTGYPNSIGPMTLGGTIVGFADSEDIYMHSFAWPGASGSGVFNENGKLIGYVMAISLGFTEYGISVLEDIVIVVPLYKIDWRELEN